MKTEVKNLNAEIEFHATIEGQQWTTELKKAEDALLARVKIPGFRPGKVPPATAKKQISQGQVYEQAINKLSNVIYQNALEHKEIKEAKIVGSPRISIKSVDNQKLVAVLTFDKMPSLKLKKYKGLGVKTEKAVVSDAELNGEIDKIVNRQSMASTKASGIAAKNDVVVFDFKGLDEKGVAFDGGSAEDYELTLGSNQFIPGFEDQMVGLKVGQEKELKVTFPKDYHAANLAGKPAKFIVKIKEVKELQKAKLTDELVAKMAINDVKTIQQFKDYMKDQIMQQKLLGIYERANKLIIEELDKQIEVSLPHSIIQSEEKRLMEIFNQQLKERKMTLAEYMKKENVTDEALHARMHKDAEKNVRLSMALQQVIDQEKISVLEKEVDEHLAKVGKLYNISLEEVKKIIVDTSSIKTQLLNDKVFRFLREHA